VLLLLRLVLEVLHRLLVLEVLEAHGELWEIMVLVGRIRGLVMEVIGAQLDIIFAEIVLLPGRLQALDTGCQNN